MRDFVCPDPACGDKGRTVVAKKAEPMLLVVSRWVECVEVDGAYRLTCPACHRFIWWPGEVAVRLPKVA